MREPRGYCWTMKGRACYRGREAAARKTVLLDMLIFAIFLVMPACRARQKKKKRIVSRTFGNERGIEVVSQEWPAALFTANIVAQLRVNERERSGVGQVRVYTP